MDIVCNNNLQKLQWSVSHKAQLVISPSAISLQLNSGEVLGDKASVTSAKTESVNKTIAAINYKKTSIANQYQQLTLNCKGDFGVVFRAYNDAVAYRFTTKKKGGLIVKNEEANFHFTDDHKAFIPIQWDYRGGKNFNSSFEALYHELNLSVNKGLLLLQLLVVIYSYPRAQQTVI